MSKRSKDGLLAVVFVAFVLGACPPASAECERADCPRCRPHVDGHCRAGCPQAVAWYATPSNTRHYGGYYVGGGKPLLGESRSLDEGAWGWDFFGYTIDKRIQLKWSHGRCAQGGAGAYKTDGPRLLHAR